jgi:hypothetical protein
VNAFVAQPAISPVQLGPRSVYDFMLSSCEENITKDICSECKLYVDGPGRFMPRVPLLSISFYQRHICRWVASPSYEVLIREDDRLRIELNPALDNTVVQLFSRKQEKDSNGLWRSLPESYSERYRWFGGKLVETDIQCTEISFVKSVDDEDDEDDFDPEDVWEDTPPRKYSGRMLDWED